MCFTSFSGIICGTTMILNTMTTKTSKPEHITHKNPQKSCAFHIKNTQNKANLNNSECPLTACMSTSYVKLATFYIKKTNPIQTQYKANSNPNKPNFKKTRLEPNPLVKKDYRNDPHPMQNKNKPNTNPIRKHKRKYFH